ncbi:PH domain-containing protein [Ceratocystis lukuohia]|uniref:PH domain-containing protein n=1 Tax=Ceratocystis lukuohia TaxID=2019550 RepID=A0ABR4MMF5_9PEZI
MATVIAIPPLAMKCWSAPERPESVVTEFVDVDWIEDYNDMPLDLDDEDASSEYGNSARNSLDSTHANLAFSISFSLPSQGSKSMTTVSSYDEASTPRSSASHETFAAVHNGHMADTEVVSFYSRPKISISAPKALEDSAAHSQPVEGPRGPHLFHLNTSSFQTEDYVLSLSPLTPLAETRPATTDSLAEGGRTASWPDIEFEKPPVNTFEEPIHRQQPRMQRQITRDYFTNAELDPLRLALWSPEMVAQSMLNAGVEMSVAHKFIEHDIDGSIMGTLKFQDLKELGIPSFGMRTVIWNQIKVLCSLKPTSPIPLTPIEAPVTAIPQGVFGGRRHQAVAASPISAASPTLTMKQSVPSRRPSRRPRTGRNAKPGANDIISPLDSVSIVGIEQVIPKPHRCEKGEKCRKFRRQKNLIEQFRREHPGAIEVDSQHLLIAGDPGNPNTAPRLDLCSPITPTVASPTVDFGPSSVDKASSVAARPTSDTVPSVVASSDVLGPGATPLTQPYLQADLLNNVKKRDPQDNVKQFLDFQRAQTHGPKQPQPNHRLRTLPRLAIPGKSTALPTQQHQQHQQQQPLGYQRHTSIGKSGLSQVTNVEDSPAKQQQASAKDSSQPSTVTNAAFVPYSMEKASPLAQELASPTSAVADPFRFGTPFSEMDVPVTHVSSGPVARSVSQSVPPEMKLNHSYSHALPVRSQSRASHRRPSFSIMPAVDEDREIPAFMKSGPKAPLPARGPMGTATPPPSGATLKAPPRFNYPWSPVERKIPFETAIPPVVKSATVATAVAPSTTPAAAVTSDATTATTGVTAPKVDASSSSVHSASSHESVATTTASSLTSVSSTSSSSSSTPAPPAESSITHQGPMKKRRTHFLRYEWQDGFFTLKGTRLAMHKDSANTQRTLEYVDIDDYAIACSSLASQSKLAAKFKVASIRRGSKPKDNVANFSFQLVPAEKQSSGHSSNNGLGNATMSSGPFGAASTSRFKKRLSNGISFSPAAPATLANASASTQATGAAAPEPAPAGATNGTGKTHHFAVKNRNQQIGWMRELMLAKAIKQKGEGFEVRVNGNAI